MLPIPPQSAKAYGQYQLSQQQTLPYPAVAASSSPVSPLQPEISSKKRTYTRIVAIAIAMGLALALYFIWRTSSPTTVSSGITQQNFGSTSSTASSSAPDSGTIEVYIVGAV